LRSIEDDGLYDDEVTALYRKEARPLIGYLIRRGVDPSLVEDIVQDAFFATRQQWSKVRSYERPKAYLYRVASNRSHRVHVNHRRAGESHANLGVLGRVGDPEERLDALDLQRAIDKLPRRQQEVVLLFYSCGFSQKEIATILQIEVGTVKSHLNHARTRLAELLGIEENPA
jgi:RNA polymerase sigma-70 factor (ECF subfamily)